MNRNFERSRIKFAMKLEKNQFIIHYKYLIWPEQPQAQI